MGSFAVQQYLYDHSADADGVVLTGTAAIDLLEPALDLDQPIDLSEFNAPFQPARTDYDWLSRDEAIVDAYVADPRCGFGIDTGAARAMFAGRQGGADPAQVAAIRSGLPLYIAVGEADPVQRRAGAAHPADRAVPGGGTDRRDGPHLPGRPPRDPERDQPGRGYRRADQLAGPGAAPGIAKAG